MAVAAGPGRSWSWVRYPLGGLALLLAAPLTPWNKTPNWPVNIVLAAGGLSIILGYRRIFRPAVARTAPEEVRCRFAPWYEGYVYVALMIAVASAAATVQGFTTGPAWFGYSGIFVLALMVLGLFGIAATVRQPFLSLTQSTLAVRGSARGASATVIPRAAIAAIGPPTVTTPAVELTRRMEPRQIQITYRANDSSAELLTKMLPVVVLTVDPDDLLHALQFWKDGDPIDPAMMDRVESVLRGKSPTSA